ncbi:hypothetical protein M0805_004435 [Coniferiporia weirii]|nr:hypothetical protein M0805_004435 [Coniferiporia weirii]
MQHKRVLLVSHAAIVIALIRGLIDDRELPLRVGRCSLTVLRRKKGREGVKGAYEHIKLASGDHLREGASRDWGFEDIVVKDGKVVEDIGVPGTEHEEDHTVGSQVSDLEQRSKM